MGKTQYKKSWENEYSWVKRYPASADYAFCIPCGKKIKIVSGGAQLAQHGKYQTHIDNVHKSKDQARFETLDGKLSIQAPTSQRKVLTTEEKVLQAEIVRCLDLVDSNCSFSSADCDNDKYAKMFPDSDIAKAYHQKRNKVKYMLQFGIAPVIQRKLLAELKDQPYTFKFDETTTSQIKKQYDAYATYHSHHFGRVVTIYLGTLFVGRCTADDLLSDFNTMLDKLHLNDEFIISLGMDGPNVNKLFEKKLNFQFEKKGKTLIPVGTCTLHTVATAFSVGLKMLEPDFELDQFAIELHSFFKYSAKRIEQYFTTDLITNLEPQRILRHCETRWLSLQKILMRIFEQLQNLKVYFLETITKDLSFKGKNGVGASAKYLPIKKLLTSKKLPVIMTAVIYVAQVFKAFTIPLQTTQPMITVLFPKMQKLLQGLLAIFMKDVVLTKKKNILPIQKIRKINLTDHSNQNAKCNLGSCAEKEMSKLDRLDQKQVDDMMKVFLASACNYLLERLPLDNQVIRDARYLHPYSQGDERSSGAIERLVTVTWNALGLKGMIPTFNLKPNSTTFELIDVLKKELDEFKLENIPKDFIDKEKSSFKLKLSNPSYWRECYDLVGLQKCDASDSMVGVEEYWIKVMTMEDEDWHW